MRPHPIGREERPLEVGAQHAGTRLGRHGLQCLDRRRLGRGDERRLVRGDAGKQERLARTLVVVRWGGEEIDASVAVDLEIDEARDRNAPSRTSGETDGGDPPVFDLDIPGDELAANECRLDSQPHTGTPQPASAELTASQTRAESGVARCVM